MIQDATSIFINYASPDQGRVLPFYDHLRTQGFNVWMDCRNLRPGQNWDFEIKRELDKATFVLAFISQNSFDRRGYVQRELRLALDKLNEKLIDDIYLIPVLLDDSVRIPEPLRPIQCIKASDLECNNRIVDALNHQLQRLGVERNETQRKEGISWDKRLLRESWDGIPGYEVELQYWEFRSERYLNIGEITDYIKGRLLSSLFEHRAQKIDPMPKVFNYGQDKYSRTNTYDAHCGEPIVIGRVISVQYAIHWYGAGAAHPNHYFETYNFLLEPLIRIPSLSSVVTEPNRALAVIQDEVRRILYDVRIGDDPQAEHAKLELGWIDKGTSSWDDLDAFRFTKGGVEILFAPYHVAPYACGPQFAHIPFTVLAPLMRTEYVSAMHVERFVR